MKSFFLQTAISRSEYYKSLGESAFSQLTEEEIHFCYRTEDNNIAILVKHIGGNLRSRWTDFQNSDGEKPWRNRDAEFEDDIKGLKELQNIWDVGWLCFILALKKLNPKDLLNDVYIRKEKHTVLAAIQRQLNHNAYHIGQIIYLAKSIRGENWKNLSISKGDSALFNKKLGM